jgi:hypothetical protein
MTTVQQHRQDAYVDTAGIIRWISNDRIPFPDMLMDFLSAGLATADTVAASMTQRRQEDEASLKAYVKRNRGRKLSSEEQSEMTAAFGPGHSVVNCLTGDVYQT